MGPNELSILMRNYVDCVFRLAGVFLFF